MSTPDSCEPCGNIECVNPSDYSYYDIQGQINPGPPPPVFFNVPVSQTVTCPGGELFNFTGTLQSWMTLDVVNGQFIGKAGVFAGSDQDSANAAAQSALSKFVSDQTALGHVQCGFWNTSQSFTCSDSSVQTVPALTYFSTVSQAAANALALAAATAQCDFLLNLAARYKINDFPAATPSSNTHVNDSSVNANHITSGLGTAANFWVTGRPPSGTSAMEWVGSAYGKIGRSDISQGLAGLPTGQNPWSITMWMRRTTLLPVNNLQFMFGFGDNSAPGSFAAITIDLPTGIGVQVRSGSNDFALPNDTNWHHYAAVWPGGNVSLSNLVFYVDAVAKPSLGLIDVTPNIPGFGNREITMAGAPAVNPTPGNFLPDADLSDCRIYTIALNAAQVLTIFNAAPV